MYLRHNVTLEGEQKNPAESARIGPEFRRVVVVHLAAFYLHYQIPHILFISEFDMRNGIVQCNTFSNDQHIIIIFFPLVKLACGHFSSHLIVSSKHVVDSHGAIEPCRWKTSMCFTNASNEACVLYIKIILFISCYIFVFVIYILYD